MPGRLFVALLLDWVLALRDVYHIAGTRRCLKHWKSAVHVSLENVRVFIFSCSKNVLLLHSQPCLLRIGHQPFFIRRVYRCVEQHKRAYGAV